MSFCEDLGRTQEALWRNPLRHEMRQDCAGQVRQGGDQVMSAYDRTNSLFAIVLLFLLVASSSAAAAEKTDETIPLLRELAACRMAVGKDYFEARAKMLSDREKAAKALGKMRTKGLVGKGDYLAAALKTRVEAPKLAAKFDAAFDAMLKTSKVIALFRDKKDYDMVVPGNHYYSLGYRLTGGAEGPLHQLREALGVVDSGEKAPAGKLASDRFVCLVLERVSKDAGMNAPLRWALVSGLLLPLEVREGLLAHRCPGVRMAALQSCRPSLLKSRESTLKAMLNDASPAVRWAAGAVLIQIHKDCSDRDVLALAPVVGRLAADSDEKVRLALARDLAPLGAKAAVLTEVLKRDKSKAVRDVIDAAEEKKGE
jgi:hypothetical protein